MWITVIVWKFPGYTLFLSRHLQADFTWVPPDIYRRTPWRSCLCSGSQVEPGHAVVLSDARTEEVPSSVQKIQNTNNVAKYFYTVLQTTLNPYELNLQLTIDKMVCCNNFFSNIKSRFKIFKKKETIIDGFNMKNIPAYKVLMSLAKFSCTQINIYLYRKCNPDIPMLWTHSSLARTFATSMWLSHFTAFSRSGSA